jgi:hypothetical protein
VFENLLEEPHNRRLLKLLYHTAEWHALAKLRTHTEGTLTLLETLTVQFGKLIRQFRDLSCSEFNTFELPREADARRRRLAAEVQTNPTSTSSSTPANPERTAMPTNPIDQPAVVESATASDPPLSLPAVAAGTSGGRKPRTLNLFTVKFHFLGDYVQHIRLFGTTDSYSTQLVCLQCIYFDTR